VWRRRREATLDDVVEVLQGIGRMLQEIDGKLEDIVGILGEDDDEA
jgi:hypothetical protein